MFDTVKFLDSEIECEIKIRISDMVGDKINVTFEIDDDLIKIKYAGNLTFIKNI